MLRIVDHLSELVYVVNLANYELMYVNQTCIDLFHLSEWKGKNCYELLQGRDKPCPFCNIHELEEKKELCWQFYNPVVERHYQLRDRLIAWEGHPAKLEIANDISELVERQEEQAVLLQLEQLVNRCARNLIHLDHVEDALHQVLKEVGEFIRCDRVYIFQINSGVMNNTHEWCAENVKSEQSYCQNMPVSLISRWIPYFEKEGSMVIRDVGALYGSFQREYEALKPQNIHSLIASPIKWDHELIGYLGIDNYIPAKEKLILQLLPSVNYFISAMLRYSIIMEYDLMTGIYNRNRYICDLEKSYDFPVGVVYVDINGMKQINDRSNHAYGDHILKKAADLLRKTFPEGSCYRIGGDEFAVILNPISSLEFDCKVRKLKRELAADLEFDAAVGNKWSEEPENIEQLMARADEKMYEQKKEFYHSQNVTGRYRHYLDVALDLIQPEALENRIQAGRFLIYYQPKFSVSSEKLTGAEALVRYQDEDGTICPPVQFITELEENELIHILDYYVFEQVCRQLSDWMSHGVNPVPVAVNFSRYTLGREDFIARIQAIRKKYTLPSLMIEVEITETAEAENMKHFYQTVERLQNCEFRVAIDDFGAQFANLNLLSDVHFDVLKIDMHIITNVQGFHEGESINKKSGRTFSIIRHLTDICNEFGIHTVAEGVETQEQMKLLKHTKCDDVQGYFFSKPIPTEQYTKQFLLKEPISENSIK